MGREGRPDQGGLRLVHLARRQVCPGAAELSEHAFTSRGPDSNVRAFFLTCITICPRLRSAPIRATIAMGRLNMKARFIRLACIALPLLLSACANDGAP